MTNNIQFRQSCNDFPLTVGVGRKMPDWSLSRWKENRGLRFVPFDDEGFSLRGDSRQLLYKGNRRSHRFTILNDEAFEYDCILNKEPESNVISLRMEGAEYFDFFRQPDFVRDPFLKGSYAVYLKDTFVGQGTGKLCHIHRPLIIDACGRKVWGTLSVAGNELRITIPEQWLAEAKYPVVVDPVVGTTTLGSVAEYSEWVEYGGYAGYEYYPNVLDHVYMLNRYVFPERWNGLISAYTYIGTYTYVTLDGYSEIESYHNSIYPILFAESNEYPSIRLSRQEQPYDTQITQSKPIGWREAAFQTNGYIAAGANVWFGCYAKCYCPFYFDYGERNVSVEQYFSGAVTFPDRIPTAYNEAQFNDCNMKISTYLMYNSQNFIRTLTQGVTLNDNNNFILELKRKITQDVICSTVISKIGIYLRKCIQSVSITETLQKLGEYIRGLYVEAGNMAETSRAAEYYRFENDTVQAEGSVFRHLLIFIKLVSASFVRDFVIRRFLIAREELVLKSCIARELTLESKIC